MKSIAAVLVELKKPLEIWELDIPVLKKGQVLVEVAYSGLCQSQLNEVRGHKGEDRFVPHTLGHEGSGKVLEVGEGVTKVAPGDHVVLSWIKGEGHDVPNCAYRYQDKTVNSGAISTFLSHAVISENRIIPIPREMPLKEAALLGCAIPTGAGVVRHEMGLKAGASCAIFGVGGIGLAALLAARGEGASIIIAIDVSKEKLERAKRCGATHLINVKEEDPLLAIAKITQDRGVDFAFEAAGRKATMEQAFSSVKAPGGLAVLAGNLPKGEKISIDPFDLIRGKNLRGTWGGKATIDRDIPYYISLFMEKQVPFEELITHEVTLEGLNTLLDELEGGRVGRGIIKF